MEIKRLHYFNGQFLKEPDFTTEQTYHLDMRRRLNRYLHTPGVAFGLKVTAGANQVTVDPGMAIDPQGRELIVETQQVLPVPSAPAVVALAYQEQQTDSTSETGIAGNTRWTEKAVLSTSDGQGAVVLARITGIGAGGDVVLDPNYRTPYSVPVVKGDLAVDNNLTVKGNLEVQGETVQVRTERTRGNVQLGDDDNDTVTIEGRILTGHTSGRLQIGAPTTITGDLSVAGAVMLPGNPTDPLHAVPKQFLDAHANAANPHSRSLAKAGDTMSGPLTLLSNPTVPLHAATKQYVDAHTSAVNPHSGSLAKAGDTMTGALTLSGNPTAALHAAPKQYVDGRVAKAGDTMTGALSISATGTGLSVTNNASVGGSLTVNGNVGIGTSTPGAALEVAGTVRGAALDVTGSIRSPMFDVTQVFNSKAGGLPVSAAFSSQGGTLLIFASGSGWSADVARQIGMQIQIDSAIKGYAKSFTNETGSHKVFSANPLVVSGIAAGPHTLALVALASTSTDGNDFFNVTVLELPWASNRIAFERVYSGTDFLTRIGRIG